MADINIADAAGVVGALIAAVALLLGMESFRRQRDAADIATVVTLFNSVNSYWDRFIADPEGILSTYHIGQVLSYFEQTCYLVNHRLIGRKAAECLAAQIASVWQSFTNDPVFKARIEGLVSDAETFKEIKVFARRRALFGPED